ncbi:MAG: hypothetical protein OEZ43_00010 [Gammaproteobacteria bacterium]|nr:hypothetical protein [Gammaproteobacteria bacterium]
MNKQLLIKISFLVLITANVVSVAWFCVEGGFEPAITSLLIFSAIMGLFVERWIAQKDKRKELLYSLAHELYLNVGTLYDAKFIAKGEELEKPVVFPRLVDSVVDASISSGVFIDSGDKKLFNFLHLWRNMVQQFNQRLMVTEHATFANTSKDNVKLWRGKLSEGRVLKDARNLSKEFLSYLVENYKDESGIDENTILFEEPGE